MSRIDPRLQAFQEQVAMKYQVYNGLFLGLPFEDLADTGVQLPLFANLCREQLQAGKSPREIVARYFKERPGRQGHETQVKVLFKFLQLVERQVVLFDALEDAAFPAVNDLEGAGSLGHLLARVADQRKQEALEKELDGYKVRIVLTAHPTQFYPDSILGIITDLSEAIEADKLPAINDLLLQMGKTRFQNRQRPTPLDEAKSLIWYLEHIFYTTVPALSARLLGALSEARQDPFLHAPKVELGFWPGGDRDGNPFVTSEITRKVAEALKASVIGLYLRDLEALLGRLTFDGVIQPLQAVRDRVEASAPRAPSGEIRPYASPAELLADLRPLRKALLEDHQGLFISRLDDFIHKVQAFGFHFAALDLRQDSRVHGAALEAVFSRLYSRGHLAAPHGQRKGAWPRGQASGPDPVAELLEEMGGYGAFSAEGKAEFLARCLEAPDLKAEFLPDELDPLAADTLASLAAARAIQESNGERALCRYVISNSNSALNVLEVMTLARLAGWKAGAIGLDIVPLFETIEDLRHAEGTMRKLYAHPAYAAHLERRGRAQTIMLGFSDGTKDGGYITANWSIHKAKRDLTRVSREAGVRAIFFDGRGGPPARGGGNTHKFYRSMGADIEHGEIQLTVQGQTISSNFGTPEAARYNLEQLFTAGLEGKLFPAESPDLQPEDVRLLDRLSQHSREAYRKFREDPLFLPYLEEMTPLPYYGMLNIASRPTRRKASSLRFEDLRAIPFVGAWSQMKQNIPGFYGIGIGMGKLTARGGRRKLEELYRSSLFFRTLVENAMMSLSKSYFPLTRYLEKDRKYGRFWRRIYKEATDARAILKEITGQHRLLETSPAVRESIRLRERIILPLLVIQQYAMGMVKAGQRNPDSLPKGALDAYAKMVVKAMAANINAARNSA